VDGGTGECRTVVDTLGADLMEKVDSCEKSVPERNREAKHNSRIPKAPYHHAAAGTESQYAHSSELPAKIDDQKKKPMSRSRQTGSRTGIKTATEKKRRQSRKTTQKEGAPK